MILTEKDILTFGQYAGRTVRSVLETHPAYLFWLDATEGPHELDSALSLKVTLATSEEDKRNIPH